MAGVLAEEDVVVEVVRVVIAHLQVLGSLVEIAEHKLIRLLERGTLLGLIALVVLGDDHAQLLCSLLIVVVSLAEAFDQLRVSQSSCKQGLALILLQLVELCVAIGVGSHALDVVEQEVAVVDHLVERGVHSLYVCIGRLDVLPSEDVAISIRVALHAEDEVCLQVGQDCEVARIQGAALETVVDTYH